MKMNLFPTKDLRLSVGESLAAAEPLAQAADANIVCLIKAPFLLDENLVAGGFSYANFAGNANLPIGLNDQQVGIDPASLQQLITLVPPAGGWRWETTGLGNLPQTIYGFVVVTNPSVGPSVLIGMQTFLNPVHLSEAGQEIVIDAIEMPIALQPLGD